jgi:hypothetical protein
MVRKVRIETMTHFSRSQFAITKDQISTLTPDSSYKLRCLGAIRSTASLSPASYARLNSSLSSSSWLVRRESGGVEKGRSNRRERNVPATIVWIQGRAVETLTSSSIHEDRLAGGHPANPRIAKSPYWSGASAAAVSRISD